MINISKREKGSNGLFIVNKADAVVHAIFYSSRVFGIIAGNGLAIERMVIEAEL